MRRVDQRRVGLEAPVRRYVRSCGYEMRRWPSGSPSSLCSTAPSAGPSDLMEDTGKGDDALAYSVEAIGDLEQVTPLGLSFSSNNGSLVTSPRPARGTASNTAAWRRPDASNRTRLTPCDHARGPGSPRVSISTFAGVRCISACVIA